MDFIELFGVPGSGKSFYTKKIASESKLLSYIDFSNNFINKICFKAFVRLRLSSIIEPKASKQVFKLYSPYKKKKNIFGFKDRFNLDVKLETYLQQLIYVYHVQKKLIKKNKKMVFDEGILHRIIAIESEFGVPHSVSITALRYLTSNFDVEYLFIHCDCKTACSRVVDRNRNQTALDFLRGKNLEKFIDSYDKVCVKFSEELTKVKVIENDKI